MLVRILRRYLKPYKREIAIIIAFQLVATIAALALPALNANIIDTGILRGDTGYILRMGGWMLAVSLVQAAATIAAVYFGARAAMAFGRDDGTVRVQQVHEFMLTPSAAPTANLLGS